MSILHYWKFQGKGNMNQTRQKSMHAAGNFDTKELLSHLLSLCTTWLSFDAPESLGTKLSLLIYVVDVIVWCKQINKTYPKIK